MNENSKVNIWSKITQRIIRPAARFIQPPSDCLLCRQLVGSQQQGSALICDYCHQRLPLIQACCPVCAMPSASSTSACGQCIKQSPAFSQTVAAFHYEPPVSEFIGQIKFSGQLYLLKLLQPYLLAAIRHHYQSAPLPQLLLPVPLHPKKQRQRGFNQAKLLAGSLARQLSLPLSVKQCSRVRNTRAQSELDAVKRQRNLKGAFSVSGHLPDHVAVIDDVMTTGATANELSQTLLNAGAKQVDIWCIARAYALD